MNDTVNESLRHFGGAMFRTAVIVGTMFAMLGVWKSCSSAPPSPDRCEWMTVVKNDTCNKNINVQHCLVLLEDNTSFKVQQYVFEGQKIRVCRPEVEWTDYVQPSPEAPPEDFGKDSECVLVDLYDGARVGACKIGGKWVEVSRF